MDVLRGNNTIERENNNKEITRRLLQLRLSVCVRVGACVRVCVCGFMTFITISSSLLTNIINLITIEVEEGLGGIR